ncbi:peptidase M6 [Bacillus mycoides]|uniref:immune inhibitor A domain-containing protein n=1 Tax=Bacillus cereus group TaxID=86661 RepID=UPI0008723B47|nr:immune inhibitor A domain-containing protein [Bacillus mycoides]OFD35802.1 peptidase M6 [Bacillus mycoides]OFD35975.1 peptidase M6 [Bacillus mycoides]OFD36190.1 peptidase M6 [Bacillus mycoides]OFD52977.1 peptidase M6 [Bacillus mycoides]OFD53185.1 peptidase M6 [Bacillus mycoides]
MKKKTFKLLSKLALVATLVCLISPESQSVSAETTKKILPTAPIDENLIPKERLADSLKERGEINPAASNKETVEAVENYIERKKGGKQGKEEINRDRLSTEASNFLKSVKDTKADVKYQVNHSASDSSTENTPALVKGSLNGHVPTSPAKEKEYNGEVRKDKVLVLLVEFEDFKHNNIDKHPHYMYSDDFNQDHYQKMLFGNDLFQLYDGTSIKSFKKYYEEQSGGSYTVDGTVTKWLTLPGKAADYGRDADSGGRDNQGPKGPTDLVKGALQAAVDSGIDLSEFDQFDQYDINGDGDRNQPDGVIDHLMLIHAGMGQEAGGGKLGNDAVWSHRSIVSSLPYEIEGTKSKAPYWNGKIAAFDYTIEPEDGTVGVFAHEFGHDLGLPDEYDNSLEKKGWGEPIAGWSLMSTGSWAGKIIGTTPTSFSPQNKEFFQKIMGGNWVNIAEVDYDQLNKGIGYATYLDQSVSKTERPGMIRVNLPDKEVKGIEPSFGKKYYYSTKGDNIHTTLETPMFDLTKSNNVQFDFKTLYEIETDHDLLEVYAVTEDGTNILIDKIGKNNVRNGTDTTQGNWIDKSYDLSQFRGKKVKIVFEYMTDDSLTLNGFALDNATLTVDGKLIFSDDTEGTPKFKLDGFAISNGIEKKKHNYYLEWRNYAGSDEALKYSQGPAYNTGMVVWYADSSYIDNWIGVHPGHGFLGVVDSHPKAIVGTLNGKPTFRNSTRFQIADAAFSFNQTPSWKVVSSKSGTFVYDGLPGVAKFDDSNTYINEQIPDAGRILPKLGLKFEVVGQADDNTAGAIRLYR